MVPLVSHPSDLLLPQTALQCFSVLLPKRVSDHEVLQIEPIFLIFSNVQVVYFINLVIIIANRMVLLIIPGDFF